MLELPEAGREPMKGQPTNGAPRQRLSLERIREGVAGAVECVADG
jgi:hypothetical protein